jgi:hypothetical protein
VRFVTGARMGLSASETSKGDDLMTGFRDGVRSIVRITGIGFAEFSDAVAHADEFKLARDVKELGIMTAAPWRRVHT